MSDVIIRIEETSEYVDTIHGHVEIQNFDNTQIIHSRWIQLKNYNTGGKDIDGEKWEAKLVDEISLMTRKDGEDWDETFLIDGDGEYVDGEFVDGKYFDFEEELFQIINRTKWRQMITNLTADPHESLIKFDANLKLDGDADIANYIKKIPDFTDWVRKHALAEMYPLLMDGDGEFVDFEEELFQIINRTKGRQMISNLTADPHESLIKFDANLKLDGDADIAYYIKKIPNFTDWVRKHALSEMYP